MNQLGFSFSLDSKMLLKNFVGKKNTQITDFISQLFSQKTGSIVYIYGDKSNGKTHLLQGCAFAAVANNKKVIYADFKKPTASSIFNDSRAMDWVCLDNIDNLNAQQQQNLFDFYNYSKTTSIKLIVSANTLPNKLNLLADLKTRLSLSVVFRLQTLSDENKKRIIKQQIQNRNITIQNKIYAYLFNYYSRDLSVLLTAIDYLDRASLQQKCKISTTFVKQQLVDIEAQLLSQHTLNLHLN